MADAKLDNTLRTLVVNQMIPLYGRKQVCESLNRILSDLNYDGAGQCARRPIKISAVRQKRTRPRATAPEHVSRMRLPPEKQSAMAELADRFDAKSFLPTFGDIAEFCRIYGIAEPASRSRASAIPRVFKFIGTLEADEIQRMVDDGLFSGPARLGPISDAIRHYGRATRAAANAPHANRTYP